MTVSVILVLGFFGAAITAAPGDSRLKLYDTDSHLVDPLYISNKTAAAVIIYISTDCPISNRYAPAIRRLHTQFTPRGVLFQLVYPNPSDSAAIIRRHLALFNYSMRALRDPTHLLVGRTQAAITPESVVIDRNGHVTYRGRIDDRYTALGVERPQPTQYDLERALTQTLDGEPVTNPITQAVGCFIADFKQ